jgi:DNA (cytosine-5)-methyltransferase 1
MVLAERCRGAAGMKEPSLPAISLFTNCGAGDLGYAKAGFRFQVLAELQSRRLDVAALNHPQASTVPGDLRNTWPRVIEEYRARMQSARPALLSACPPCQGMSSARSGRGLASDPDAGSRDTRNLLVDIVARVANELQPRIVVVENVLAFLTRQVRHPDTDETISAARLLVERLETRYELFALRADLADFGVPQTRRRAFLVLVHRDEPGLVRLRTVGTAPFPGATHGPDRLYPHATIRQALLELDAGPLDSMTVESAGEGLHRVPVWDHRRRFMVASIPANSGAGAWANTNCQACGPMDVLGDAATCPRCDAPLARPVVCENGGWRLVRGFPNSSYTRMHPDRPAATITTATGRIGSDNTLHPSEHRVLSMLECQHLQTFPRNFDWGDHLERYGHTSLRQMIGEAVPPQFTELHGRVLASVLRGRAPRGAMPTSDRRVRDSTGAVTRQQGST